MLYCSLSPSAPKIPCSPSETAVIFIHKKRNALAVILQENRAEAAASRDIAGCNIHGASLDSVLVLRNLLLKVFGPCHVGLTYIG